MKSSDRAGAFAVLFFFSSIAVLSFAQTVPLAELVSVMTEDQVLLHGLHYKARGNSKAVVIYIPGGTGAFYARHNTAALAESLIQNGYHFLSMNMRTAGVNGWMFIKFEDYLKDVEAAVRFAKNKGLSEIILLGRSLGAPRVVYYLTQSRDTSIKALILTAAIKSPYLEAQMRWNEAERAQFDEFLKKQRAKVAAGQGREISTYPWFAGRNLLVSAATWVNTFGTLQESNASTVKFTRDVKVPVLIIHGKKDTVALPPNADQIYASLTSSPKKDLVWIEGAGHPFVGYEEEYAQAITDWIKKTFPASKN